MLCGIKNVHYWSARRKWNSTNEHKKFLSPAKFSSAIFPRRLFARFGVAKLFDFNNICTSVCLSVRLCMAVFLSVSVCDCVCPCVCVYGWKFIAKQREASQEHQASATPRYLLSLPVYTTWDCSLHSFRFLLEFFSNISYKKMNSEFLQIF